MNYDEVVAACYAYADRYDSETTGFVSSFIALAEARINRLLKVRQASTRAFLVSILDQVYYGLPPDYAGMRNIQYNTGVNGIQVVKYRTPEQLDDMKAAGYIGSSFYTIVADQIQLSMAIEAGIQIEISYYQKVPNLTTLAPINWVSENHPDVYVSAVTTEISLFVKDYDAAQIWNARLDKAISDLQFADSEERWAGSTLVITPC
jgi:hypothetical protein